MMFDIQLSFDGGYLKLLKSEDVHVGYVNGLNDPDVNRYLDSVKQSVQTEKSVADFIQYNIDSKDSVFFGIWQDGALNHCGTVRLHGIESFHHTAHIGVCIFDKTVWGQGVGSKAIKIFSNWALKNFNLRWIEAGAYEQNIASQKAFLLAGYKWMYDISGKYLFEKTPATVKLYALQASVNLDNNIRI